MRKTRGKIQGTRLNSVIRLWSPWKMTLSNDSRPLNTEYSHSHESWYLVYSDTESNNDRWGIRDVVFVLESISILQLVHRIDT